MEHGVPSLHSLIPPPVHISLNGYDGVLNGEENQDKNIFIIMFTNPMKMSRPTLI